MLGEMDNDRIYSLVNRANRRKRIKEDKKVDLKILMQSIKEIRETGYSVAYGEVLSEVGALAIALPFTFSGREIVLSVGGPSDRIHKKENYLGECLMAKTHELEDNLS